jgi:hypothetical protein
VQIRVAALITTGRLRLRLRPVWRGTQALCGDLHCSRVLIDSLDDRRAAGAGEEVIFERDRIGTGEAAQTVTFRDVLRVCGATVWLSEHVLDRIASLVSAQWSIGSIGNGTGYR